VSRTGTGTGTRLATDPEIEKLYQAARDGHRRSLGRLLSDVERGGPRSEVISELAHAEGGRAHVVGITGSPGSGKSTLTGRLVALLAAEGRRPAVLAVDPSSPLSGGAILGDRIRMDAVVEPGSGHRDAFIRSMATRGHSGGLALAVPLATWLFDAAGYDPVIIETVGVGQVEVDVVSAADTAIVVVPPGMGDAVQANKAGLLEVADVFVVNKADRPGANDVRRDLELMLDLSHLTGQDGPSGYRPPIVMASALEGTGAAEVWAAAAAHLVHLDASGLRAVRRRDRVRAEIKARMEQRLAAMTESVLSSPLGIDVLAEAEAGVVPPTRASAVLLAKVAEIAGGPL
jgi:LAO/AO transport system kinase